MRLQEPFVLTSKKMHLGNDKDGNPIYLKDIWPSDEEIDALVKVAVKPEQFKKVYIPMFDLGEHEKAASPLY